MAILVVLIVGGIVGFRVAVDILKGRVAEDVGTLGRKGGEAVGQAAKGTGAG